MNKQHFQILDVLRNPEALPATQLPTGTACYTETFSRAVVTYKTLTEINGDANPYLQELWSTLLQTGRKHMLENTTVGSQIMTNSTQRLWTESP